MDSRENYNKEFKIWCRTTLTKIIIEEYKVLPLICTLIVGLLTIFESFSTLIKNFLFFQISFLIFLNLIWFSLIAYLGNLYRDQEKLWKECFNKNKEIQENKKPPNFFEKLSKLLTQFLLESPWKLTAILIIGMGFFVVSLLPLGKRWQYAIIGAYVVFALIIQSDRIWKKIIENCN
jgi:hypothetical protein